MKFLPEEMRERRPELYGHVVENFVASELLKLLSFSDIQAELRYFRTDNGKEVDFILERTNGSLAGIEVKTSGRVDLNDFKGLEKLRGFAKDDFVCGVVLYAGDKVISFGRNLFAAPLSSLWQQSSCPVGKATRVKRRTGNCWSLTKTLSG